MIHQEEHGVNETRAQNDLLQPDTAEEDRKVIRKATELRTARGRELEGVQTR